MESLAIAAIRDRIEVFEWLFQRKQYSIISQPNALNRPFHLACIRSKVRMVKLLIEGGAEVNSLDLDVDWGTKEVALCYLCATTRVDLLKLLLDNGAHVNNSSSYVSAFTRALQYQSNEAAKLFLERNAVIREYDLSIAVRRVDAELVNMMIKKGAFVDGEPGKLSPIYQAVSHAKEETTKVLINNGAEVWIKTINNNSILVYSNFFSRCQFPAKTILFEHFHHPQKMK